MDVESNETEILGKIQLKKFLKGIKGKSIAVIQIKSKPDERFQLASLKIKAFDNN